jgi:hypothetical protein
VKRLATEAAEVDPVAQPAHPRGTRPRRRSIEVWVTEEEKVRIAELAAIAGLSQSAYLRDAGLQKTLKTVYDLEAVNDLARVRADLGRAAGLLKLWLATPDKKGRGASAQEVVSVMESFRMLQDQAFDLMGKAVRK